MQTSLRGIANKARRDRKHRFRNLIGLLDEANLNDSWRYMNRNAASGVDRVSAREYAHKLQDNIVGLVSRLKGKRYRAKLVRRVYIPKANGKSRPLGIPAVEDKLLQVAVARILNAIYEQDFLDSSYGYRPNRNARGAVQNVTVTLQRRKFSYVVDADIKGFFDNMDHEWMIRMLEERIDDRAFIGLIRKWLKAGILDADGKTTKPTAGTPQGGVVSPVIANIYLHYALDLWFEKVVKSHCVGEAYICRYADDFICAFRYGRDAERFMKALHGRLAKFGLQLSPEKTKTIRFTRFRKESQARFEFLGFEFRWGTDRKGKDLIKRRTSRQRLRVAIAAYKTWIRASRNFRLRKLFDLLNAKLRGYYNYFGMIGNSDSLTQFYRQIKRLLYKWLNRRSQRRSFNYRGFVEMTKHYELESPRITQKNPSQLELDLV